MLQEQGRRLGSFIAFVVLTLVISGGADGSPAAWSEAEIAGTSEGALTLGRDLDSDGDPDEIDIRLEVIEITEEVYPGEVVTFWVFAPEGQGMAPVARAPSPTIRVEEGDRVRVTLLNTHYFPHTIHFHGTIHPNAMDGVPDFTQPAVKPGEAFTYEFVAKNPGTHFYHCHVQPDVHVHMGLAGMFIIEPNRPSNLFTHLIPGAGRVADLSKAVAEHYDREYSLVYTDIDDQLNRIASTHRDPREIERRMHREYDSTKRSPNIFLLNGRSFPYTLRDSSIEVSTGERVKLRVLNAGERTLRLHTHGHHPTVTHLDGYNLPAAARFSRDVFTIGPAQRLDLELLAGSDSKYASGPGVWLMHDHTESATTNKGISPGGDVTAIVYDGYKDEGTGLPRAATSLERFFDPAYYRGEVPVFEPEIFHSSRQAPDDGSKITDADHGNGSQENDVPATPAQKPSHTIEDHRVVAQSCKKPRGSRRIEIKGGVQFAREGEVYGFQPRVIRAGKCETVEIVFNNMDAVRHALMVPGLDPMFMLEFAGPGSRTASFVTPDEDISLAYHCHVETHEKMGMGGILIVGEGSPLVTVSDPSSGDTTLHEGIGTIVELQPRRSRLIIDHDEIEGFMAAMEMAFKVDPPHLLNDLEVGQKVRFIIDEKKRAIIEISPVDQ